MGLERVSGYDYAAAFLEKTQAQADETRKKVDSLKTATVPMVEKKEKEDVPMGLGVEKTSKEPVEKQEKNDKEVQNNERTLNTKEGRKALKEETSKAYQENGTAADKKKIDKKQADKMADNYVKNKERIEKSDNTVSFVDEAACEKAKKAQETEEKRLEKYYQTEEGGGLSKKEAKAKIKAQHKEYRCFKNENTLNFIKEHKELFCDEKGNFSADMARKTARQWANLHTAKGEAVNGYLSLKERREIAEKFGVKDDVIADIVKITGHGFEKDNTGGYRTLHVGACTVLGGGFGFVGGETLVKATATATATSSAVIKDAAGNILASASDKSDATATARGGLLGAITGAVAGLGIGLATMHKIKDPGSVETQAYEPGKAEEEQRREIKKLHIMPTLDFPVNTPDLPDKIENPIPEKQPCFVIVQNNETISQLAKKYGVTEDQIINMNRDKVKYFHSSTNCADNRRTAGFLVGEEILIPNGCDKAGNNKDEKGAIKDYENAIRRTHERLCGGRENEWSSPEFRAKYDL